MGCRDFFNRLTPSSKLLYSKFARKKYISNDDVATTSLDRCLNTLDLTALGIGSTLGLGIYVMAGQVAKQEAGPSVTLSFLVAAIASVFAGLCYAEFGARVPRAGSAYIYSYVTVGELIAFIIGWNLVLEYVIGTASVASGYSGYINYLTNYTINNTLTHAMPMKLDWLSPYPDFLAFGITVLLAVLLSLGVEESSLFNNVCTLINLMIVVYVVIIGSMKSDTHNWKIQKSEIPPGVNGGEGGFFPFGISGMMAGAATCFYGFVGFDIIATTGEEVKNPKRAIPFSIILSLLFIFLAYFGISTVLTLMLPYYDQNEIAPIPYAFERTHSVFAKWFVLVGALTGLSTSLLGAMFPLPRILYAMANDGLLFRFLANIHPRFKTPFIATLLAGFFAGFMAMIFSLKELMDMMSIGTLMAYTLVAASVLMLRYHFSEQPTFNTVYTPLLQDDEFGHESDSELYMENSGNSVNGETDLDVHPIITLRSVTFRNIMWQYFNLDRHTTTNLLSFSVAKINVVLLGCMSMCVGACIIFLESYLLSQTLWAIIILSMFIVLLLVVLISLSLQPQNHDSLSFKVPLVPFIPALSIFINVFLMLKLSGPTWIRFGVWLIVGLLIYAFYGIKESNEGKKQKGVRPDESSKNVS